jgi:hypothetical protein
MKRVRTILLLGLLGILILGPVVSTQTVFPGQTARDDTQPPPPVCPPFCPPPGGG